MKHDEPIVNAFKGEGKDRQTREFTKTQWESMGDDKAEWKVAKPSEDTKPEDQGKDDVALLDARERYEALFDKKAHPAMKLETLEAAIAKKLEEENKQEPATPPAV